MHEAVETRVEEGAEPGTIVEVLRRGYVWRKTVLRPARVVVAADPEASETDDSTDSGGADDTTE